MRDNRENQSVIETGQAAEQSGKPVFYAMRGGHLYRSTDGINWKFEKQKIVPPVSEGTTRISRS